MKRYIYQKGTGLLPSCVYLLLLLSSCKKFLEIDPSPTLIETRDVFTSDQTALSAVSGLYSQMVATSLSLTNGGSSVFPALASDELVNNSNANYEQFKTNSISRTNPSINSIWNNAYRSIYQANAIIKGLQNSNTISDSIKKQLRGEIKFVRAFHYFYLANYFGDVPLAMETSYKENAVMPRTSVQDVYKQVVSDLEEAKSLLTAGYPSMGRVRPNKWAATALLARVYLYLSDWNKSTQNASEVINSGKYSLVTNLNSVFLSSSNEAIWQLMRETSNTSEATAFIPFSSSSVPVLSMSTYLLSAFEIGDLRKTAWIKSNTVNGKQYYYPYKYKVRSGTTVTEYLIALRFAEQFLIRAEALAEQNKITESLNDLNKVRNRAGLADYVTNNKDSLLNAIDHERQTELFAEWGHRWFDLKRKGKVDLALQTIKAPGWQVTDALFPIPQEEIDKNPFLTQNAGY